MPNRIVREGILTSDRVNSLEPREEVFYRRLLSIVDDYGRYDARPPILRAQLYPLQLDRTRESDVARGLAACEKASLIRCYEVEGKPYLEVMDFGQKVRTIASKWPHPPTHASTCAQMRADARLDGGADEGASPPTPPRGGGTDGFDHFWAVYPRKVGKRKAEALWKRLNLSSMADSVIAAVEAHKRSQQWQDEAGKYVPHPTTWLERGGWEDDVGGGASAREPKALWERCRHTLSYGGKTLPKADVGYDPSHGLVRKGDPPELWVPLDRLGEVVVDA